MLLKRYAHKRGRVNENSEFLKFFQTIKNMIRNFIFDVHCNTQYLRRPKK